MNDTFFTAVVECTQDPEKLGRVRVRILGDHTQNKTDIPSEDLPWSPVMMPITTASMNGIGDSPIGLVNGSWVVGFYRDGGDKQQPLIMGSIGGIPLDPANPDVGFNDPVACFPQETKLEEPDTNRHARGVAGKHVEEPLAVTARKDARMAIVATATGFWTEPETPYAPIYPYNHVWEGPYNPTCDGCEWGHLEEWDSTPGSERYFRQHKTSQNFLEIHPDGKEVRKIYGDGFEIDLANKHLYVEGDYNVTVMGNKTEEIKGDFYQHIEGDYIRTVEGDKVVKTAGIDSTTVLEETIRRCKKNVFEISEENILRQANESIYDSSGKTIRSITVDEHTTGTGVYIPAVIIDPPPIPMISEGMPAVVLSCAEANQVKAPNISTIIPIIPPHFVVTAGISDTQIRIVPDIVFIDSPENHVLGKIYVEDDTHFSAAVRVAKTVDIMETLYVHEEVEIEGDLTVGGDVNIGGDNIVGGNVDVGAELHAIAPVAIDPIVEHPYLVPTAGSAPIDPIPAIEPDPFVEPPKVIIEEDAEVPIKVYSESFHIATAVVPGEVFKCE